MILSCCGQIRMSIHIVQLADLPSKGVCFSYVTVLPVKYYSPKPGTLLKRYPGEKHEDHLGPSSGMKWYPILSMLTNSISYCVIY
jgi:hypothetical protein